MEKQIMSLPSANIKAQQSSIRNFFQPKSPTYAPPPAAFRTQAAATPPAPLPPAATTTEQNGPPPPISSPRPSSLHPQATISPILPEHIPALRRITALLLPVNYPDSFYARLSDPLSSGAFSRVLLWTDDNSTAAPKVIGGLVCRPEPSPFHPTSRKPNEPTSPGAQPNALYIQSLVLLSPYRRLGLAAALLDEVAALAAASPFACSDVYAHVWTDNADGLRWYLARGFAKHGGAVPGYYFKLRPDSAWIVRRQIDPNSSTATTATDLNGIASTTSIPPSTTAAAANLPTPPVLATTSTAPPPRSNGPSPLSPLRSPGMSFQNARPETEWNDLPADMHAGVLGGGPPSGASSRSSSSAPRKKRDRAYPAAAFGK
ncbi:uncharacterized protein F4822DRAFT_389448 [Hypoxylon trugodes]|uniref:uncharacterized protein n=1 Tax=Hypoxylon trugodes TaxID=326681 RepID=UPI0021A0E977|nr:uncharacterized protein F4822DRAFT_389448 [Hypoxylon trugodes]KAI1392029.1 hypothetical protein F4822DRAFT_389448 [Hypoxylon trugodes]